LQSLCFFIFGKITFDVELLLFPDCSKWFTARF
jgi:hypothetical protein